VREKESDPKESRKATAQMTSLPRKTREKAARRGDTEVVTPFGAVGSFLVGGRGAPGSRR
jgi:hypothetical protein